MTRFDIPMLWSSIPQFTAFHWPMPQGLIAKGLGGCGIHNAMLYVRALREDFVKWNVSGWTYDLALRIYIDLETFVLPGPYSETDPLTAIPPYHGTSGPIHTTQSGYIDQLAPLFISSALQSGIPLTVDFNNPDGGRYGVGYYTFNIFNGIRDSAAKAFLGPLIASAPANFKLLLNSPARRILLEEMTVPPPGDSAGSRLFAAVGVEFEDDKGEIVNAYLSKACGMFSCAYKGNFLLIYI